MTSVIALVWHFDRDFNVICKFSVEHNKTLCKFHKPKPAINFVDTHRYLVGSCWYYTAAWISNKFSGYRQLVGYTVNSLIACTGCAATQSQPTSMHAVRCSRAATAFHSEPNMRSDADIQHLWRQSVRSCRPRTMEQSSGRRTWKTLTYCTVNFGGQDISVRTVGPRRSVNCINCAV